MKPWIAVAGALILCFATSASAQQPTSEEPDPRTQYPPFLANSYFSLNVGSIRYIFSADQLAPGFEAESLDIPHTAARVDLFGHRFFEHLSAQVTYMRPIEYVNYKNINGDGEIHRIATTYGGLTLTFDFRLTDRISAYGEGGLGVTSRSGFQIDGKTVVKEARYAAGLLGAGLVYHVRPEIDVVLGATYSPGRKSFDQPSTRLYAMGMRYYLRRLPEAVVEENRHSKFTFPVNVVRLGYSSNVVTYGVNTALTRAAVFFGGDVETRRGFTLDYQRNVYHSSMFAVDFGASASYWKSQGEKDIFRTASVYPLLRFFVVHTESADYYASYSIAGPTYISAVIIDGRDTGDHFTFQDFIGVGAFMGKARRLNAELGLKHFSNGNIFPNNPGIKIPLTLTLGLTF